MTVQIDQELRVTEPTDPGISDVIPAGTRPQPEVEAFDYTAARDLGAQIVAGAAKVAMTTAAWVEMVGVFDARGGAEQLWMDSTAQWLAFACSMSAGTAREHVRVARALRRMPIVAGSFGRGELSFSKVRECTRLAGMIDEDVLVKAARDWTAAQLERAVRGFRAGRTTRLIAEQQRRVTTRTHSDGTVQITAYLPSEEAAAVIAALDVAVTRHRTAQRAARTEDTLDNAMIEITAEEPEGAVGVPAGTSRSGPDEDADIPAYTRADALIDVARGYVEAGPADTSGEDRDIVVIHVTADGLRHTAVPTPVAGTPVDVPAGTSTGGVTASSAWIESVGAVSASTAARVACTGTIQTLVADDTTGEPLYLGRSRRLASKQQRRVMIARDRHCQFPGCIRAVRLHAHHITPWMLGGLTDVDQMLMLCQHHHVMVHAAGITITKYRDRSGYRFTRVGGEPITAQHPSQYSNPDSTVWSIDTFHEATLLAELIEDARRLDPGIRAVEPKPKHAGWDLPEAMESVRGRTDFYDFETNVFPRWGGERMTEGSYWDILEPHALEPRTNPDARY